MTKIQWVEVEQIKRAKFNPPTRTTQAALRELRALIERNGFDEFRPLLISKNGILGDGHRRLSCAIDLGMKKVPVVYTDKSLEELYRANDGGAHHRPSQWLYAYENGMRDIPQRIKSKIDVLRRVIGDDGIRRLSERGVSPTIYDWAIQVCRYCSDESDEFCKSVIFWMDEHGQQFKARLAIRDGIDPEVLISAINTNRPLQKGAWHTAL